MLNNFLLRNVFSGTGGRYTKGIFKYFSGVERRSRRVQRENLEFDNFDWDFSRLENQNDFDEAVFLMRKIAVEEKLISKQERSYLFFMLRRVNFFEKCDFDEFRIFALETLSNEFGTPKQQEDVKNGLGRILVENLMLPGLKIELCLEILEKYERVYKATMNQKLLLDLFEVPIDYINSSIQFCSLRQILKCYYFNCFFMIESEDDMQKIENIIGEKIFEDCDILENEIDNWTLVNTLWAIAATRYRNLDLDLNDNFYIEAQELSENNKKIFQKIFEILEQRKNKLTPYQIHRTNFALEILNQQTDFNFHKFLNKNQKNLNQEKKTISRVHKDVIAVLRAAGYKNLEYEKEIIDSFYVDIFLPDLDIFIEVNGPNHYIPHYGDNFDVLNSSSKMKFGLLSEIGFRCLSLNSQEWNKLKGFREKEIFLNKWINKINFFYNNN